MAIREGQEVYRLRGESHAKFVYIPLAAILLTVLVPRGLYFLLALYTAVYVYCLFYFSSFRRDAFRELGLNLKALRANFNQDVMNAGIIGVLLFVFNYLVFTSLLSGKAAGLGLLAIPAILIIRIVINTVEELFWRGFLQHELKEQMGFGNPVLASGLMFGLWSVNAWFFPSRLANFVMASIVGMVCGYLLEKTERLELPIFTRTIMDVLTFAFI